MQVTQVKTIQFIFSLLNFFLIKDTKKTNTNVKGFFFFIMKINSMVNPHYIFRNCKIAPNKPPYPLLKIKKGTVEILAFSLRLKKFNGSWNNQQQQKDTMLVVEREEGVFLML